MIGTFPAISETFIIREIEALRKRGLYVTVFAIKRAELLHIERSLLNADTLATCIFARPDHFLRHAFVNLKSMICNPFRYLRAFSLYVREVLRLQPVLFIQLLYHFICGIGFVEKLNNLGVEHVHCHFSTGTNMALAANLFSGIPFSFTVHASGDIYMNPVMLETKIKWARFIVPCCDYNKRYLDDITGFAYSNKLHRIYNGVDMNEPGRLNAETHKGMPFDFKDANTLYIVSVGSLLVMKGHSTLIQACALLKKRGHSIRCEIIGDGPERENLANLIAKFGMTGHVELSGPQPLSYVYKALERADIFALLSEISVNGHRDGFPTVILEAMAMGRPVVSTFISGIPEIVVDGITGFLVHERDAEAAADVIERLIVNSHLRKQFGDAGRKRVGERFLLDRMIDQLVELFTRNWDTELSS